MNRIVAARKKWIDALHARNLYSVLDCYAKNHIFKGTMNKKVTDGKDDTKQYFEQFLQKEPIVTFVKSEIKQVKDTYVDYGTYSFQTKNDGFIYANYQFVYTLYETEAKIVSHFSSKI